MTVDQLCGLGPYSNINVQLQFPVPIHHKSAQLAEEALRTLPGEKKGPSFSGVKQGATEQYHHFIDRLWEALDTHPDLDNPTRESLFKVLAYENASPKAKIILSTLPQGSPVDAMLEKMAKNDQVQQAAYVAEAVKAAVQGQLVATAIKGGVQPKQKGPIGLCYKCGKRGHTRIRCKATVWCDMCRNDTHATAVCRKSGNWNKSAHGGRATTTAAAVTHRPQTYKDPSYTNGDQQPRGASGSTWRPL